MMSDVIEMAKFNLLRLPYVALKEVMNMWNPFELITFSLINTTTKLITKSMTKRARFWSRLFIDENFAISFNQTYISYEYQLTNDKTQHNQESSEDDEIMRMAKYFENGQNGFFSWCEYVLDVLNANIETVILNTDNFRNNFENYKAIIGWLRHFSKTIDAIQLDGTPGQEPADEIVSYFLENVRITETLLLYCPLTENFKTPLPTLCSVLAISTENPVKFINMQQVLEMETRGISIDRANYSNEELKNFIWAWMTSQTNKNWKSFSSQFKDENSFSEIMEMLKNETGNPDLFEQIDEKRFEIQRNDGKRAKFRLQNNLWFTFSIVIDYASYFSQL